MKKARVCELCSEEASLYCASDAAYLCWSCDAGVHQANFLVARHVRRALCSSCRRFDGRLLSGAGSRPIPNVCLRCSSEAGDTCKSSLSSSSSSSSSLSCFSDCVSSTESLPAAEKARIRTRSTTGPRRTSGSDWRCRRAEGILVIWARRLRLGSAAGACLRLALRAFEACMREFTVLPFRACLAASLWLAANACEPRGASTWQLMRLEQCSGVPRKLIVWGVSRLAQAVKAEREGWAESSDG